MKQKANEQGREEGKEGNGKEMRQISKEEVIESNGK